MIMPDGTVVDENGNIIGRVDENGNVVDLEGNIIGTTTDPGSAIEQQGSKGDQKMTGCLFSAPLIRTTIGTAANLWEPAAERERRTLRSCAD